ncbi:XkdX family protein [Shouchella clausii]|uniref:XkdX family protein n=1 Tax=Shouchella clausii TaxID=79880 RepID=UPI00211BE2AB|nr:XkdX family protein [Shouchella clausii]
MEEVKRSPRFEDLKRRYEKNWCRKDQLRRFVELEALTPEEYEIITGEPFETGEDDETA